MGHKDDEPKEPPLILTKFPFWVAVPVSTWIIIIIMWMGPLIPVPRTPVPIHGSGRESWYPDDDELDGEGT